MYHQTSRRVIRDVETERRFDSALSCVRRGGAPLNPLIRDQVREIAEEVVSGGDVIICAASAVVPLTKSDPILYGALCRILHSTGESPAFGKLPLEQLSDLRPSVCGQVLLSAASTHSKYRFAAAGPSQLGATRYVVAATAAAEVFGPRCLAAVPPESAFLATYLRTVGHIFLAWGYASVYPRLFRANRADPTELERALR
ncbi:MAG: hypothetical protein IT290_12220, partial [Deltaproteobacteria bacterium]|nr:hypothetical protein [Deltaproteobacteria bacterium]